MAAVDNPYTFSLDSLKNRVEQIVVDLKDKSEAELRNLHVLALDLESDIKKEITILRQRAANLAVDTKTDAEEAVIEAKILLGRAIAWLEKLEQHLSGAIKDHNTGEKFE
jgi:hypothetical protein